MIEDIFDRKAAEAALRFAMEEALEAACTDSLTGLPDRTAFNEALTKPARTGEQAIVFIDVDGFKRINDSLGHGTGDDLIRRLAARLNAFGAWLLPGPRRRGRVRLPRDRARRRRAHGS